MHSITYCLFNNSSSLNFIYILFSPLDNIDEFTTRVHISIKFISLGISFEIDLVEIKLILFNLEMIISLSKFILSNK